MKRIAHPVIQAAVLFGICVFLLIQRQPIASASPEADFVSLFTIQAITDSPQETAPPLPHPTPAPAPITESPDSPFDDYTSSEIEDTSSTVEPTTANISSEPSQASISSESTLLNEPTDTEPTTRLDWIPAVSTGKPELFQKVPKYIKAIMAPENEDFERLKCPAPTSDRYDYLTVPTSHSSKKPKYFFALDLYQYAHGLPRLLGSVIETIHFLGPHGCVLSIVEGRSTDGTYEILAALESEMEQLGVKYILQTSDINPAGEGVNRIEALAELRNQALAPLYNKPTDFDLDTTVMFINDVSICMEDILELVHQRAYQKADMTCALDWINDASVFYDVWIGRQINGDLFFEISQNGDWKYSQNLLWNDAGARDRLDHGRPFQVFACWNGAAVFTARPLLQQKVRFRSNREGECYLGEPVHFAQDFWKEGYGKIAVVPSVNIGYTDDQSIKVKKSHGTVSRWIEEEDTQKDLIEWDHEPPKNIKCVWDYHHPSWVRWNQ